MEGYYTITYEGVLRIMGMSLLGNPLGCKRCATWIYILVLNSFWGTKATAGMYEDSLRLSPGVNSIRLEIIEDLIRRG